MHSETGHLNPTPPFDFDQSLHFLGLFSPTQDEQTLSSGFLTKAVSIDSSPVAFRLNLSGTVVAPTLDYTLFSMQPIAAQLRSATLDRISFYLSLDDNLAPFYEIGRNDPHFASVMEQLYGYHQVKFLTPFENACWAVLSQRTPMPVARKIKQALVERFGGSVDVEGEAHWAFPEPEQLAGASERDLLEVVRNERKTDYLQGLARAFALVDEAFLRTGSYDEVEAWLRGLKGIGEWSASFILVRGLGRMERLPLGEKRLVEAVSHVYGAGKTLTDDAIGRIAERYGEWQGYWAHYIRAAS